MNWVNTQTYLMPALNVYLFGFLVLTNSILFTFQIGAGRRDLRSAAFIWALFNAAALAVCTSALFHIYFTQVIGGHL